MPNQHFLTEHAEYWSFFSRRENVGAQKLKKLHAHFGSIKEAWVHGSEQEYIRAGIDQKTASALARRQASHPSDELRILQEETISVISFLDEAYPPLLREIPDHPAVLFCRGNVELLRSHSSLGVVGTRKMSSYGREAVSLIVPPLAAAGITIISGMAMGIDGVAHHITLDAGGATIAVLASGVDNQSVYPKIHAHLAQRVRENGLLVSEFPPGTSPRDYFFPFRNRIIAGLSRGVLIIEAPEKSGTLLTAQYALEYNRDVFAVPNPITSPNAATPNMLLKRGAIVVERAEDILRSWELDGKTSPALSSVTQPESPEELLVYSLLHKEPLHIDELVRQSHLDTSKISVIVTLMEMKGLIHRMEGGYYRKA